MHNAKFHKNVKVDGNKMVAHIEFGGFVTTIQEEDKRIGLSCSVEGKRTLQVYGVVMWPQ